MVTMYELIFSQTMDKTTKDTKKPDEKKFIAADGGDEAKGRNPKRGQKAETKDAKPPTDRKSVV